MSYPLRLRLIRFLRFVLVSSLLGWSSLWLTACAAPDVPAAQIAPQTYAVPPPQGFTVADGSRPLVFPADFGAHPDFRTEWWYYTGNLATPEGRRFGFQLTIFRVGLIPPVVTLPSDSAWYNHSLYFAHFAVSDISIDTFYAYERYSRPGPGLAGAQASPYRVWLEDWQIAETAPRTYRLQAAQGELRLDLTLTDEMGVILHGEAGYSRKGREPGNASYYYSQPRLRAEGALTVQGRTYPVSGLAWKDHEFSTGVLDEGQIGWDWFSLQFEDGRALMLFQLRQRDGGISPSSSATFIRADGSATLLSKADFDLSITRHWRSPRTGGEYPAGWQIRLSAPDCVLDIQPWMNDQEVHFPAVTYWEGAVRFTGQCEGAPVGGNGYIELTGYAGNLPLP